VNFNKRRALIKRENAIKPAENKEEHKKRKSTKVKKKRYTKFFDVDNGDKLVDAIVEIAEAKQFKYKKSDEYFMVDVEIKNKGYETKIQMTVAKHPNAEARCISFENIEGSGELFKSAFKLFKKYLKRSFKYSGEQ